MALRASGLWLRYAAKFDPFLALHPGAIQGKEGIKFCHLATLIRNLSLGDDEAASGAGFKRGRRGSGGGGRKFDKERIKILFIF